MADGLDNFLERSNLELLPWQRRLLRALVALPAGERATALRKLGGRDGGRRAGKSMMEVEMIKASHACDRTLKIGTPDAAATIARLRASFPACLFSIDAAGVEVHPRKMK